MCDMLHVGSPANPGGVCSGYYCYFLPEWLSWIVESRSILQFVQDTFNSVYFFSDTTKYSVLAFLIKVVMTLKLTITINSNTNFICLYQLSKTTQEPMQVVIHSIY